MKEECSHESPVTDHQSPAGGEGPGFVRGMQTRGRGVENRGGAGIKLLFVFPMPPRAGAKKPVRKDFFPTILFAIQKHWFFKFYFPPLSPTQHHPPTTPPSNT